MVEEGGRGQGRGSGREYERGCGRGSRANIAYKGSDHNVQEPGYAERKMNISFLGSGPEGDVLGGHGVISIYLSIHINIHLFVYPPM